MEYEVLKTRIVGVAPLVLHNGQTADPLNVYAREKAVIAKRKPHTEADQLQMKKLGFKAALYFYDDRIVLPSNMIEATIIAGAKKSKAGKLAQAGVIVEKHSVLEYEGPKDFEGLFADERFHLNAIVRIGAQRVPTTRPMFRNWAADLEILYVPDVINKHDLLTALRNAGNFCGVGDWRPRHGRFALEMDRSKQKERAKAA